MCLRRNEPEFIDTLDYIFVSRRCEVLDVLSLPDISSAKKTGPQPTAEQPSDHLLLAATIRFPLNHSRSGYGRGGGDGMGRRVPAGRGLGRGGVGSSDGGRSDRRFRRGNKVADRRGAPSRARRQNKRRHTTDASADAREHAGNTTLV